MKKNLIKTLALAFALSMGTSAVFAPKADAGILLLLGTVGGNGPGTLASGIILIVLGGPAGIVIGEDGKKIDQVETTLFNKYPFLNREARLALSDEVRAQYQAKQDANGNA